MSKRYEFWKGTSEIIDNKTGKLITLDCPDLLNKLDSNLKKKQNTIEVLVKDSKDSKKLYEMQIQQLKHNENFEKEKKENAWKFIEELKEKLNSFERLAENNKKVAMLVSKEHNDKILILEKELELAVSQIVKLSNQIGDCESSCPAYEICKGLTHGDCRNIIFKFLEVKAKEMLNE